MPPAFHVVIAPARAPVFHQMSLSPLGSSVYVTAVAPPQSGLEEQKSTQRYPPFPSLDNICCFFTPFSSSRQAKRSNVNSQPTFSQPSLCLDHYCNSQQIEARSMEGNSTLRSHCPWFLICGGRFYVEVSHTLLANSYKRTADNLSCYISTHSLAREHACNSPLWSFGWH